MSATSFHPQYKMKRNWWFTYRGKSWVIETPFSRFMKRAAKRSLNRMWRHFLLDDAYTKISGVFCPAPGAAPHSRFTCRDPNQWLPNFLKMLVLALFQISQVYFTCRSLSIWTVLGWEILAPINFPFSRKFSRVSRSAALAFLVLGSEPILYHLTF